MFFPGKDRFNIQKTIYIKNLRKDSNCFPARHQMRFNREGIFQFISEKKGSLTIETALVLPLFLFGMLAMLQFAAIQNASSALLAGAQDTAKEMAAYAYIQNIEPSGKQNLSSDLLKGGLSAAYAGGQIRSKSGVGKEMGSVSLLQTSFCDGQILDLVGTFQPAHTFTVLPVKKVKSIFRTRVRAWTGRTGSVVEQQKETEEETEEEEHFYVTETGTVYHKNPECTHIRLSIRNVPRNQLSGLRNVSGGKYHACEKCGPGDGSNVYISPYGDKYHSSLSCSGLKRTVHIVSAKDIENMRPCSKCGK